MRFDIITIFPEIVESFFSGGVLKKALDKSVIEVKVHDLRDFALDKHKQVDDRPFGGKQGMVLKPEPIFAAVKAIRKGSETSVCLLSPQGKTFNSCLAEELALSPQVILICGRYEGVDERVIKYLITDELSIGDYVLTGGEPAAVVIIDAVARFIPGVVGKEESVKQDSFAGALLDHPHYTRPREYEGMKVPDVLFSGDHNKIEEWRRRKALEKTLIKRPDLLKKRVLSPEEKKILEDIKIKTEKKGQKDESDQSC